ncbi:MAG: hypothetical protein IT287_01025, partial [Bdellovibrionaceae bacterium]|nr:hypothetical protein [Pseudobdellovibrionaceae bacterium]
MKHLFSILITLLFAVTTYAVDDYVFSCDQNGVKINSILGMKKAPESPVVGLNIKVLKAQVPLYLIQASFDQTTKNLFVTDWVMPDVLSQEGQDLLSLLSLFYDVKIDDLVSLRAGLPTDLL